MSNDGADRMTIDDLIAIHASLRKNAVPPIIIDGDPYMLMDSETGAVLHPDQWKDAEDFIRSRRCGCGGKISVNNSVMLCDKCGYGAHVKVEIDE